MNFIKNTIPEDLELRKHYAIFISILITGPLTAWGIYGIGQYGIAMFILTPFLIGFLPTVIYAHDRNITKKESFKVSFITLGVFTICLIVFAVEGLICIAMAAPIGVALTWFGAFLGRRFVNKRANNTLNISILIILSIPLTAYVEKDVKPTLYTVTTTVEINANIHDVWNNVIEFPAMDAPTEFIFKAGISYPIDSEIKGNGEGAVRYCNFNTGSFVEPITEWDEPNVLRFDVEEQPVPMTEYSLWDIDAPHLHDYFVSEKGEFKLTKISEGKTRLSGTTWYRHNIKPGFYWKGWSQWILHSIHERVLNHIKANAEAK